MTDHTLSEHEERMERLKKMLGDSDTEISVTEDFNRLDILSRIQEIQGEAVSWFKGLLLVCSIRLIRVRI